MDRDSAGRRRGVRIWVSIAQRDNQRRLYPASATYADQAGADARRLLEHLAARHPDLLWAFRESLHECLGARGRSRRDRLSPAGRVMLPGPGARARRRLPLQGARQDRARVHPRPPRGGGALPGADRLRRCRRELGTPARVAKPSRPGPGRPKGSGKGQAPRYLLPGEANMPRTEKGALTREKVKT